MLRIACALLLVLSACNPDLEGGDQPSESPRIGEISSMVAPTGSSVGLPLGNDIYRFTRYGVDIKIQTYRLCPGRTDAIGSVVSNSPPVCIRPYNPPSCASLCCEWAAAGAPPSYLYKEDTSTGIQFVLYEQAMSTNTCDSTPPYDW